MIGKRCWTLGLVLCLLAAFVIPAFAQPAGTLVVGLVAEPVNLDPAQVTDLNSNRVGRRVVETLVTFPEEKTEVVPGLAESWTISKDGLQHTFKLRQGITFHDGTPFNAAGVKFSIERQVNPDHPANKLGKYPFELPSISPTPAQDGGLVLLKGVDTQLRLTKSLAACLDDHRQPAKVQHQTIELLRQRIFGIAGGYADCNDAARLTDDVIHKLVVGRDPIASPALASQPTLSRFENAVGRRELSDMGMSTPQPSINSRPVFGLELDGR